MSSPKPHASIVFIGHVDSGKSTTIGHLLYQSGLIDDSSLNSASREARIRGMQSYKFAYITDKLQEERNRRVTIEAASRRLETELYSWTVINTPGYRDFIGNMISGTAEADIGVLIIAASVGEYEAGISEWGQTREHPLLAYTLGVKKLICCVNKMDEASVNWSQARFHEIETDTGSYLRSVGYRAEDILFIPISGWLGQNLISKSESMLWYTGPSLIQAIDSMMVVPKRSAERPLRFPIRKIYKIVRVGPVLVGRIETGRVYTGQTLLIVPGNYKTKVLSIEIQHKSVEEATAGDVVGVRVESLGAGEVNAGDIACEEGRECAMECESFVAQIVVINHPGQIKNGYTAVVDCHSTHIPCRFDQILTQMDRKTMQILEHDPRCLRTGDSAIVRFIPQKPMCVETIFDYSQLGRFVVRDSKQCVAVGFIKEVIKRPGGVYTLRERMLGV